MKKLIMTKGLPGSGKTTWAKEYLEKHDQNALLVCKDDLRAMMFNSAWSGRREATVIAIRDFVIIQALHEGRNVIVHDTNLAPKHEARLKQIAKEHQATFEARDFTHVSLEQCIQNDLKRCKSVGEKVIRDMYKQFLKPKPVPVEWNKDLPSSIICDLDGTLALFGDKNPYERDFTEDEVNYVVKGMLLNSANTETVLFVSGRQEKFRDQTEEWLHRVWGFNYKLFMRPTDDVRKDYVIKKEIYENHIKGKYNISFVLDDRNQTVNGWRELGLVCLQVADGDF